MSMEYIFSSSSFSFLFPCQQQSCWKPHSLWANSKNRTVCVTVLGTIFLWSVQKTETGVYFHGKAPFNAFYIQHIFSLKESEITQKLPQLPCRLPFKQPPTFEAVALTFAHPIFIRGIFQTPERRIEKEITTEEHTTSCGLLSLTCFGGNKQTKVCSEAFPGELFSPAPVLSRCFLCEAAAFICRTVLWWPFYAPFFIYLVRFRMHYRHTHTQIQS